MQVNPDIEKVKFWERSEAIPKNAIILFHGLQTFSGAICFNLS